MKLGSQKSRKVSFATPQPPVDENRSTAAPAHSSLAARLSTRSSVDSSRGSQTAAVGGDGFGPCSAGHNGHAHALSAVLRESGARLVVANAGDHRPIHGLLRAVHQAPSYEDFTSWIDEPSYEPRDRLLVKQGERIVAHVQVLRRVAWFCGVKIAIGGIQDLAVLPEYASLGYDRVLLSAAEQAMREDNAVLAMFCSPWPETFRAPGWIEAGVRGHSRANVNDLLAHLSAAPAATSLKRSRAIHVRRWRHVELDAVRAVYREVAARRWGPLCRAEQYWQWLIGRRAHSDLIVAVEGRDAWDDMEFESRIVGYVVTHGSQILELHCLPNYELAAPLLLARTCQDAIERDSHTLSLRTSANDPLHELMITAGGEWCIDERAAADLWMVKMLDAPRWIEQIYPVLRHRAQAAGLARPLEISFDTGSDHFRLTITRRSSRLVAERPAPENLSLGESPPHDTTMAATASADPTTADLNCKPEALAALLIGGLNIEQACSEGLIRAVAGEQVLCGLAALFPPTLFWQSQFDWLRF